MTYAATPLAATARSTLAAPLALGLIAVAAMVRSFLPLSRAAAALFHHCIPGFHGIPVTRALSH
jgi:hypothetical protein